MRSAYSSKAKLHVRQRPRSPIRKFSEGTKRVLDARTELMRLEAEPLMFVKPPRQGRPHTRETFAEGATYGRRSVLWQSPPSNRLKTYMKEQSHKVNPNYVAPLGTVDEMRRRMGLPEGVRGGDGSHRPSSSTRTDSTRTPTVHLSPSISTSTSTLQQPQSAVQSFHSPLLAQKRRPRARAQTVSSQPAGGNWQSSYPAAVRSAGVSGPAGTRPPWHPPPTAPAVPLVESAGTVHEGPAVQSARTITHQAPGLASAGAPSARTAPRRHAHPTAPAVPAVQSARTAHAAPAVQSAGAGRAVHASPGNSGIARFQPPPPRNMHAAQSSSEDRKSSSAAPTDGTTQHNALQQPVEAVTRHDWATTHQYSRAYSAYAKHTRAPMLGPLTLQGSRNVAVACGRGGYGQQRVAQPRPGPVGAVALPKQLDDDEHRPNNHDAPHVVLQLDDSPTRPRLSDNLPSPTGWHGTHPAGLHVQAVTGDSFSRPSDHYSRWRGSKLPVSERSASAVRQSSVAAHSQAHERVRLARLEFQLKRELAQETQSWVDEKTGGSILGASASLASGRQRAAESLIHRARLTALRSHAEQRAEEARRREKAEALWRQQQDAARRQALEDAAQREREAAEAQRLAQEQAEARLRQRTARYEAFLNAQEQQAQAAVAQMARQAELERANVREVMRRQMEEWQKPGPRPIRPIALFFVGPPSCGKTTLGQYFESMNMAQFQTRLRREPIPSAAQGYMSLLPSTYEVSERSGGRRDSSRSGTQASSWHSWQTAENTLANPTTRSQTGVGRSSMTGRLSTKARRMKDDRDMTHLPSWLGHGGFSVVGSQTLAGNVSGWVEGPEDDEKELTEAQDEDKDQGQDDAATSEDALINGNIDGTLVKTPGDQPTEVVSASQANLPNYRFPSNLVVRWVHVGRLIEMRAQRAVDKQYQSKLAELRHEARRRLQGNRSIEDLLYEVAALKRRKRIPYREEFYPTSGKSRKTPEEDVMQYFQPTPPNPLVPLEAFPYGIPAYLSEQEKKLDSQVAWYVRSRQPVPVSLQIQVVKAQIRSWVMELHSIRQGWFATLAQQQRSEEQTARRHRRSCFMVTLIEGFPSDVSGWRQWLGRCSPPHGWDWTPVVTPPKLLGPPPSTHEPATLITVVEAAEKAGGLDKQDGAEPGAERISTASGRKPRRQSKSVKADSSAGSGGNAEKKQKKTKKKKRRKKKRKTKKKPGAGGGPQDVLSAREAEKSGGEEGKLAVQSRQTRALSSPAAGSESSTRSTATQQPASTPSVSQQPTGRDRGPSVSARSRLLSISGRPRRQSTQLFGGTFAGFDPESSEDDSDPSDEEDEEEEAAAAVEEKTAVVVRHSRAAPSIDLGEVERYVHEKGIGMVWVTPQELGGVPLGDAVFECSDHKQAAEKRKVELKRRKSVLVGLGGFGKQGTPGVSPATDGAAGKSTLPAGLEAFRATMLRESDEDDTDSEGDEKHAAGGAEGDAQAAHEQVTMSSDPAARLTATPLALGEEGYADEEPAVSPRSRVSPRTNADFLKNKKHSRRLSVNSPFRTSTFLAGGGHRKGQFSFTDALAAVDAESNAQVEGAGSAADAGALDSSRTVAAVQPGARRGHRRNRSFVGTLPIFSPKSQRIAPATPSSGGGDESLEEVRGVGCESACLMVRVNVQRIEQRLVQEVRDRSDQVCSGEIARLEAKKAAANLRLTQRLDAVKDKWWAAENARRSEEEARDAETVAAVLAEGGPQCKINAKERGAVLEKVRVKKWKRRERAFTERFSDREDEMYQKWLSKFSQRRSKLLATQQARLQKAEEKLSGKFVGYNQTVRVLLEPYLRKNPRTVINVDALGSLAELKFAAAGRLFRTLSLLDYGSVRGVFGMHAAEVARREAAERAAREEEERRQAVEEERRRKLREKDVTRWREEEKARQMLKQHELSYTEKADSFNIMSLYAQEQLLGLPMRDVEYVFTHYSRDPGGKLKVASRAFKRLVRDMMDRAMLHYKFMLKQERPNLTEYIVDNMCKTERQYIFGGKTVELQTKNVARSAKQLLDRQKSGLISFSDFRLGWNAFAAKYLEQDDGKKAGICAIM